LVAEFCYFRAAFFRHFRLGGNSVAFGESRWIPAFAGTTEYFFPSSLLLLLVALQIFNKATAL